MVDDNRKLLFDKATKDMIATNKASYNHWNSYARNPVRYRGIYKDKEKVERIIEGNSLAEQRALSEAYFEKEGFYKRIIVHYATLLKYMGILIPSVGYGQKISAENNKKKYYKALSYVEKMKLPTFCIHCGLQVLIYGCYYGIIQRADKEVFSIMDLPWDYCRTRFKDAYGNDIVEFNLQYFNTILDEDDRKACLKTFPKFVAKEYKKLGKTRTDNWIFLPTDIGIYFSLAEKESPFFLSVIPATIDYDDTVADERIGQQEEIKKLIVQKVPHLTTTGELLFEPPEAEVMHRGAVEMLSGNQNLSVLTTYCDVDAVVSRTVENATNNYIDKMITNIFNEAGVSRELFAAQSNLALEYSLKNDINLMMMLANKIGNFVTNIINNIFGNNSLFFKYKFLPISIFTEDKFIDNSFKLGGMGYSLLMPALAMGLSQRDIIDLKDLENDVLNITDKLIPPQSAYTQSENGVEEKKRGGQEKDNSDKAEQTEKNIKAIENQGG